MPPFDPFTIDPETLAKLPFRFIRDVRVLPCEFSDSIVTLYCYDTAEMAEWRVAQLQEALAAELRFIPVDQKTLDRAIDFHFPENAVTVRNCKFAFECPQRWSELSPTESDRERFCPVCNESVHWFVSGRAAAREGAGKCIAYADEYGEYVGKIEGNF